MKFALATALLAGSAIAHPLWGVPPARRLSKLALRDYIPFIGFDNDGNTPSTDFPDFPNDFPNDFNGSLNGTVDANVDDDGNVSVDGNVSSGSASDANGGTVTNDAGADGTIDNDGTSGTRNSNLLLNSF